MRVLTFNLWHGLSPSSPLAFEALEPTARRKLRERMQVEALASVRADFSFLQEVNPVTVRAPDLGRALAMNVEYQPDLSGLKVFGLGVPINLHSGLTLMGDPRFPLKLVAAVSLSRPGFNWVRKWASWQLKEERFALFCETLVPGWGKVLLGVTHLHHGLEATPKLLADIDQVATEHELNSAFLSEIKERILRGNQRRLTEMAIVLRTIKQFEKKYAGVILCGDFNAEPDNELFHILKECGFRDAWVEKHGQEPGHTWDPQANTANHLLQANFPLSLVVEDLTFSAKIKDRLLQIARAHENRSRRIDYIWFKSNGPQVSVDSVELIGRPNADGMAPSDHFGVVAEFKAQP